MRGTIVLDIGMILGCAAALFLLWSGKELHAIYIMLCLLVAEVSAIRLILAKSKGQA